MFQLILFGAIAILLLTLLGIAALRGRPEGGAETLVDAQQALDSLQSELLARELVDRIFAKDDLDFIRGQAIPEAQEIFFKERKKIALTWIIRVREQLSLLRRLHLGSARYYARLNVRTELAIAFNFAVLLLECRLLQGAFHVGGAFAAPAIAGNVTQLAGRVCEMSKQSLVGLTPIDLGTLPNSPSNNLGGT